MKLLLPLLCTLCSVCSADYAVFYQYADTSCKTPLLTTQNLISECALLLYWSNPHVGFGWVSHCAALPAPRVAAAAPFQATAKRVKGQLDPVAPPLFRASIRAL